jgi:hypothetical protein
MLREIFAAELTRVARPDPPLRALEPELRESEAFTLAYARWLDGLSRAIDLRRAARRETMHAAMLRMRAARGG